MQTNFLYFHGLRWIGWDVAVTDDGVELIEANYGHDAAEIDNNPKYKLVKDLLDL